MQISDYRRVLGTRARAELTRRYAPAEVEVLIDAVRTLPQADDSGVLAALLG